jgi:hypothetical protein
MRVIAPSLEPSGYTCIGGAAAAGLAEGRGASPLRGAARSGARIPAANSAAPADAASDPRNQRRLCLISVILFLKPPTARRVAANIML